MLVHDVVGVSRMSPLSGDIVELTPVRGPSFVRIVAASSPRPALLTTTRDPADKRKVWQMNAIKLGASWMLNLPECVPTQSLVLSLKVQNYSRIQIIKYLKLLLQTMESSQEITFVLENNGVGSIILNRPRALNALTLDMIRRMTATLEAWEKDDNVNIIIVKGEGDRAFCAGGDVKSIASAKGEPFQTDFIREEYKLDLLISTLRTPYISVWDGVVMGGGVGISRMGSVRIATERTVFAMPECAIGLIPDVGAGFFLPLLPGKLGLFLGLTGHRVTGWECRHLGLATHYIPVNRLDAALAKVTSLTEPSLENIMRTLAEFESEAPIENNADYLSKYAEEINLTFNAESLTDVITNLQRGTESEFCGESLAKINKGSPTSLALTFRQLSLQTSSYREALIIEYRYINFC